MNDAISLGAAPYIFFPDPNAISANDATADKSPVALAAQQQQNQAVLDAAAVTVDTITVAAQETADSSDVMPGGGNDSDSNQTTTTQTTTANIADLLYPGVGSTSPEEALAVLFESGLAATDTALPAATTTAAIQQLSTEASFKAYAVGKTEAGNSFTNASNSFSWAAGITNNSANAAIHKEVAALKQKAEKC